MWSMFFMFQMGMLTTNPKIPWLEYLTSNRSWNSVVTYLTAIRCHHWYRIMNLNKIVQNTESKCETDNICNIQMHHFMLQTETCMDATVQLLQWCPSWMPKVNSWNKYVTSWRPIKLEFMCIKYATFCYFCCNHLSWRFWRSLALDNLLKEQSLHIPKTLSAWHFIQTLLQIT